jgi:glycosyltransferase involved in cell wall biosynthesis
MKIAVDARMLKAIPNDGISRFTWEVLKRIIRNNPADEFILLFDRDFDKSLLFASNARGIKIGPQTSHPVLWYIWHELKLPDVLRSIKPDVILSPDGIITLRTDVPSVPVIHDISFYYRPDDVPFIISLYYRHFFRKFARKAERILTVSEFSKKDISLYLKIDPDLIDVACNGVSDYFSPASELECSEFRKKITGGSPYFLFVGNFSPRKNIPGVIKAYNHFRSVSKSNHRLVLTGGKLFLNNETNKLMRNSPWRSDIILTGSFRHEDLRLLYSSSEALVFVPWFEGFGIPAVEAMKCGVPVILSNTTSLPEIGSDAALYVDPSNTEEISKAMQSVLSDISLRKDMIKKGFDAASRYTWDNCAESVWMSLTKAVKSGR